MAAAYAWTSITKSMRSQWAVLAATTLAKLAQIQYSALHAIQPSTGCLAQPTLPNVSAWVATSTLATSSALSVSTTV